MSTTPEPIIVTGPPKPASGKLPVRQEIHDVLANPDLKNLYLLGLEEMQSPTNWHDNPLSWYNLAGIHGGPNEAWNGELDGEVRKEGGYCTHSSVLFVTWHRPYLALFEQSLYGCIQKIVARFSAERQKILKPLADNFRMPYWDWALNPLLPAEVNAQRIDVTRADGKTVPIPNPLAGYQHPKRPVGSADPTFKGRGPAGATIRASSALELSANLKRGDPLHRDWHIGAEKNARDRVFFLLSLEQSVNPNLTFESFSSNKWSNNDLSSDYDSMESIHDWIHGAIGGDMGRPDYAAFDPVFWLHHTNVDRLGALWQALHPDLDATYTFDVPQTTRGSFWIRNEGNITPRTPLVPFRKTKTAFYNSNDVKNLTRFGSTYPELINWGKVSAQQLKSEVAASVLKLYGSGPGAAPPISTARSREAQQVMMLMATPPPHIAALAQPKSDLPKVAVPEPEHDTPAPSAPATIPHVIETLAKTEKHTEYFVNLRCPKYAFNGSYTVHVIFGLPTTKPGLRSTDPNIVGSWSVFATDIHITGCAACKENAAAGLIVTGQVPLTNAIIDRAKLIGDVQGPAVTEYLKKNLNWSFHPAAGADQTETETPLANLEGKLFVSVTTVEVSKPNVVGGLPVYGKWEPLPEVTAGKPTGTKWENTEGFTGTVPAGGTGGTEL